MPEFLDGLNEGPVVLYPDRVEPLDTHDPLFTNDIWSTSESPMETVVPAINFFGAVLYNEGHQASCVLENGDDDDMYVLPSSIPLLQTYPLDICFSPI